MSIAPKTLLDLTQPDYSFYLLTRNPFQSVPVAQEEPFFLADRDSQFAELRRAVELSLYNRQMEPRMLIADFGMGKSHMLKFIRHRINRDLAAHPESPAVSVYALPGKSILDLYIAAVQDLGEEFLIQVSSSISRRYPEVQPRPEHGQQYELWGTSGRKHWVPKYVSDLWEKLPPNIQRLMNRDSFVAMMFLQDDRYRDDALYWLQGGVPKKATRETMAMSSVITKDNAADALTALVSALHVAGYAHFYLCIDELEKLTYLSTTLRSEYFEQLRYVMDRLTTGFTIFGAVTPAAWEEFESARHAFQSRLRQFKPLLLGPMSPPDIVELVRYYLFEERIAYSKATAYPHAQVREVVRQSGLSQEPSDFSLELFPFSQQVIEAIGREFNGNPRYTLGACATLIDSGYRAHRVYYDVAETLRILGVAESRQEE